VNSVVASNYLALPPAFQNHFSYEQQHWMQHLAYMPYRLSCHLMGCNNEKYDKGSGLSRAITIWIPALHWLENNHNSIIFQALVYLFSKQAYWTNFILTCLAGAGFLTFSYLWKKGKKIILII